MPEERALGAAIIAVVVGIVGVFAVVAGTFVVLAAVFGLTWPPLQPNTFFAWAAQHDVAVAGAISIVLGILFLLVARGLFRQELWALLVTFAVGLLYVVAEASGVVYDLLYGNLSITSASVLGGLLTAIVVALVLVYLAAVRDDFI